MQTDVWKHKSDVLPASRTIAARPIHQFSQRRYTEGGAGGGSSESPKFAASMQCCSCGDCEIEIMQCNGCSSLFCFGCSCLSLSTLPKVYIWSCAACVWSQHLYDANRWELIEAARVRVEEGRVNAPELYRFSQLVFDMSNTCNWESFDRCIPTLVEYAEKQLVEKQIPAIAPFHALNYVNSGVSQIMMREIAKVYAYMHVSIYVYTYERTTYSCILSFTSENTYICTNTQAYVEHDKHKALRISKVSSEDTADFHVWKKDRLVFANTSPDAQRLRIGYISSDFVDHPTADLIQVKILKSQLFMDLL